MKQVEIIDVYKSDLGVYYTDALLYVDDKEIAHIIESFDIDYVENKLFYNNYQSLENFFEDYIYSNFDSYLKLPKISKCSKLLQEIFEITSTTDSCMCWVSEDEWNNYYQEYSEKDIKILEKEIEKYNLKDVLIINEDGYKITAYGDLQTKFIIDNKQKEKGMEL